MEHTHAYSSWIVVDKPTCTEEGLRERTCSCGEKETEAIAALGHTAGEAVMENEKAPTCTTTGSYEEAVYCTVCEAEVSRKSVTVDALEHDYKGVVTDEPHCITDGEKTYTCTRCGDSYTETIDALGHGWGETKPGLAPTCTSAGYTSYKTCIRCGYTTRETIPALQHAWSEYSVDETNHWRTCTREGCSAKEQATHTFIGNTCEICGYAFYSEGLLYNVNNDTDTVTITGPGSCSDTTIYIPPLIEGKRVTEIGNNAFYNLNSLTEVVIPGSVTSIGTSAFSYCDSLTEIIIPEGVTSIGDSAFSRCKALESVTLPKGVKSIGAFAFKGCTKLAEIAIPEGVESISGAAFQRCTSLTEIVIPESVKSIGDLAFFGCDKLTTVYYRGSEAQWNNITIGLSNDALKSANIIYNYTGE